MHLVGVVVQIKQFKKNLISEENKGVGVIKKKITIEVVEKTQQKRDTTLKQQIHVP